MEKDDEVKGRGNSYDFGARMYDARVGRWLSVDAIINTKANLSSYQAFRNNPIIYIDPDGNDEYLRHKVIDQRTGTTIVYVPKDSKISEKVMTDGTGSKDVHSNNYYDFETTITYRIDKDGEVHVSKSYDIFYKNGLKDFDLAFGSDNVKNKYQNKCEADGNSWCVMLDLKGNGGSQPGGITFTTKDGGVEETRQKSLSGAREVDIEDLLTVLGALKGTSLGSKGADVVKNIVDIVIEAKDKNCAKNDKFKDDNNSEKKVVEIQTYKDHNGNKSPGPKGLISKKRAEIEEIGGGKFNKTKDTIYTEKKSY